MGIKPDDVKDNLSQLIHRGRLLYTSLVYEELDGEEKNKFENNLKKGKMKTEMPIPFNRNYEVWYTEALQAIKLLVPDRRNDFSQLYKNDKRKRLDAQTYTISDAIADVTSTGGLGLVFEWDFGRANAAPKMQQQVAILESAEKYVESVFYSMQFSLRADLFDSELDAAEELIKAEFFRAAGVMCGVVLEKNLANVCQQHVISLKKKSPTISEFNEELKNATVIDMPTWRHIQMLGDLRNICCHNKEKEPTKEQANALLTGVKKIIGTVH